MSPLKSIYGIVLGLVILTLGAPHLHASEPPGAKVAFLSGNVAYQSNHRLGWQRAKQGDFIPEGSLVRLSRGGKGRVELALSDGSVVRMMAPSKMEIKRASRKGIGIQLNLLLGHLWAKVRKVYKRRDFQILAGTSVLGVRGTSYDTVVHDDQAVDVRVFEGSVAAESQELSGVTHALARKSLEPLEIAGPKEVSLSEWLVVLESMQHLRISAKGLPSKPVAMNMNKEKKNEWIRWNLERDKVWNAQYARSADRK